MVGRLGGWCVGGVEGVKGRWCGGVVGWWGGRGGIVCQKVLALDVKSNREDWLGRPIPNSS